MQHVFWCCWRNVKNIFESTCNAFFQLDISVYESRLPQALHAYTIETEKYVHMQVYTKHIHINTHKGIIICIYLETYSIHTNNIHIWYMYINACMHTHIAHLTKRFAMAGLVVTAVARLRLCYHPWPHWECTGLCFPGVGGSMYTLGFNLSLDGIEWLRMLKNQRQGRLHNWVAHNRGDDKYDR